MFTKVYFNYSKLCERLLRDEQGDRDPVEATVLTTAGNSYDVVITEDRVETVDPQ